MNPSSKSHILILAAELGHRSSLRHLLEKHNYLVSEASRIDEAKQLEQSEFDVIIIEPNMKELHWFDLIGAFKPTPVLITSHQPSLKDAVAAMKAGAADYIAQPSTNTELLAAVQAIVNKDTSRSHPETAEPQPRTKLIGDCTAMRKLYQQILRVSPTQSTVLILGESGTGKELVARSIHEHSPRRKAPLISINCAAIPETLIESELFGHEKGSFTGAHAARKGLVEAADNGTLFLDEIGELPLEAQARLLRLLQEKEIRRIGAVTSKRVNVRLIAATHRNLKHLAKKGEFREDLYYRLHVIDLKIPPLRERHEDLAALTEFFLNKACKKHDIAAKQLAENTLRVIHKYDWPGNVRELEHALERAVILSDSELITPEILDLDIPPHFEEVIKEASEAYELVATSSTQGDESAMDLIEDPPEDLALEDYFQRFVLEHQDQMTETELAQKLGVSRKCLWERRQKFGIPRKKK